MPLPRVRSGEFAEPPGGWVLFRPVLPLEPPSDVDFGREVFRQKRLLALRLLGGHFLLGSRVPA